MDVATVCAECGNDDATEGLLCLSCLEASDRRADYAKWHHLQVATGDLDPAYPVLRHLARSWRLRADELAWLIGLHVAYYHLGSTLVAFSRTEGSPAGVGASPEALVDSPLLSLPCATERRAHRTRLKLARHLVALADSQRRGGWVWYEGDGWDWASLNDRVAELHGNGRWAAYKTAELLQKVAGAPVVATDAGHAHSSGPRKGLGLLVSDLPDGNDPATVVILDAETATLARDLDEPDVAQVETSLCDFYSLTQGHYYLGHDIDAMQSQLLDPRVPDPTPHAAWVARLDVFSSELLGEERGWWGVRSGLKHLYAERGILDWRTL
jgi:hypothetical protein